jgi:hypothetical protein
VRTISVAATPTELAVLFDGIVTWDLRGSSVWPAIRSAISSAVQWRIRSARAVWEPIDVSLTGSVGMLLTHCGAEWTPSNFHDLKRRGGIIKPIRSAGWSSNTLSADQEWKGTSEIAGHLHLLALPSFDEPKQAGLVTVHMTIQLRGWKE